METLLVLIGAYALTWPALVAVLLLGIFLEHNGARGWALTAGIVAMAISFFYFDVPVQTLAVLAVAYVAVGVIWSVWRYRVMVKAEVERVMSIPYSPSKMTTAMEYRKAHVAGLAPSNHINLLVTWIVIWPFSAIEHCVGDLINLIKMLVTDVFRSAYHRVYQSATKDLFKEQD